MMIIVCVLSPSIYLGGLYFRKVGQGAWITQERWSVGATAVGCVTGSIWRLSPSRRRVAAATACKCVMRG